MTWHIDDRALESYVAGTADSASGSSAEQHLVHCAGCRERLAVLVPGDLLDRAWTGVLEDVQAPRPSLVERMLCRLGVSTDQALLLWTAPAFRAPWLAATALTVAFVALAATTSDTRGLVLFLVVAPLLPVAGVALAYGPDADESYEITTAAPASALRLVLLRTVAVLVTTLPLIVVAGWLVPGQEGLAVTWLAPSLAAVTATLAASTWTSVSRAALAVCVIWGVLVVSVAGPGFASPTTAIAPPNIPWYLVLAIVCVVVLWRRGGRLHQLGGIS